MEITNEVREDYINVVGQLWGPTFVQRIRENGFNDSMISVVDKALYEMRECSRHVLGADAIFNIFYEVPTSVVSFGAAVISSGTNLSTWVDAWNGKRQYRLCVNPIKARYSNEVSDAIFGM